MNNPLIFIYIPKIAGTLILTVAYQIGIVVKDRDIRRPYFYIYQNTIPSH